MKWIPVVTVLLVLTLGGTIYYDNQQFNALNAQITTLTQTLTTTNDKLDTLTETTTETFELLGQDLAVTKETFDKNVKTVEQTVTQLNQQSQQQIQQLGGQLQTIKQENDKKIQNLEKTVALNLKGTDFSTIIEDVIESVVSIQTNKGVGSGVFVRNAGYIVTNWHVIEGASAAVVITSDNERHSVAVIGANQNLDIALLKIEADYQPLDFANSNNAIVGQRVIALGNPAGLQFTVTEGIISATNRQLDGNTFLQTDVPINPGNSGGPLVDAKGEILGINTRKATGYEGIGFAIPSNQVEDTIEAIFAQLQQ